MMRIFGKKNNTTFLLPLMLLIVCGLSSCDRHAREKLEAAQGKGHVVSHEMGETACSEFSNSGAYRFTLVIFGTAGNPFFTKVVAGANEAARKLGCSVDIQFGDNDSARTNNIIETAISNKIDGIGTIISLDDAYDQTIRRAIEAGIPVIAFNIDDSKGGEGNARLAYIGQDMTTAGYLIAKRLIKDGKLKAGSKVVCPVEHPEAVYAKLRYDGVKRALDQAGIKSEVLNTGGISLEDTLNKLTQYLLGHRNTDGVLAMGGMPMEMTPQAIKDVGLNIPNAGFDITKRIARNIQSGHSIATVDQQPFYQGFMTITQLYYYKKYGLMPCDINTGGAMVDRSNVKKVMDLADSVR